MATKDWSVEIEERGRAGYIYYKEKGNLIRFDYEIGGSVVALIWPPDKQIWETKYPWAIGRRPEIIERVKKEVLRQKAPNSIAEEDEQHNVIYIK